MCCNFFFLIYIDFFLCWAFRKISQNTKRSQCKLEKKLKELESNLKSDANFNEYTKCKKDLELIYERIAEGVRIRSKCR